MTPKPHDRLKAAMDTRRADLGLSLREIADAADISVETLRAVRRGSNEPSMLTRRGIEKALQWTAGSVSRILDGGEPGVAASGAGTIDGGQVKLSARGTASFDEPTEDDPKVQRAMELMAEAQALLAEIRRERREGA